MEPLGPGHRRAFRLWSVLLCLLVLLTLIAFSSGDAFGHGSNARPTPGYLNWAVSVFLIVFALMIPFAVYVYSLQMREWRARKENRSFPSRVLRGFAILVVVLLFGALVAYLRRHGFSLEGLRGFLNAGGAAGHGAHGRVQPKPYDPKFQWPVLWAAIVLVVAAAGFFLWKRVTAAPPQELVADESVADAVAASIEDALDDLETEPDARRAVIAAYARMENVLARYGLRRKQSETSLEYLQRVLLGLTSRTDAVVRLTALFERAKFSRHEIDGAMKQDAIDALRTIRDDLQPAEV